MAKGWGRAALQAAGPTYEEWGVAVDVADSSSRSGAASTFEFVPGTTATSTTTKTSVVGAMRFVCATGCRGWAASVTREGTGERRVTVIALKTYARC